MGSFWWSYGHLDVIIIHTLCGMGACGAVQFVRLTSPAPPHGHLIPFLGASPSCYLIRLSFSVMWLECAKGCTELRMPDFDHY